MSIIKANYRKLGKAGVVNRQLRSEGIEEKKNLRTKPS